MQRVRTELFMHPTISKNSSRYGQGCRRVGWSSWLPTSSLVLGWDISLIVCYFVAGMWCDLCHVRECRRALVMRRCHGSRINQKGVRMVYVSILIQPIKFTLSDGVNYLDIFFCLCFFERQRNKHKPKLNRSNKAIFKK